MRKKLAKCIVVFVIFAMFCNSVSAKHWADLYLKEMSAASVLKKIQNPDAYITRGEAIKSIARLYSQTENTTIDSSVEWIQRNGLIKGTKNGTEEGRNIMRQEMATVILQYVNHFYGRKQCEKAEFCDSSQVSDWAIDGVNFCVRNNIMAGRQNKTFAPKENITFGELAAIIYKLREYVNVVKPLRVGIIDSGLANVGIKHQTGYNFISRTKEVEDHSGHGTAIASIISEFAPKAEIIPLKITGENFVTTKDIVAEAIIAAVDDYGCNIINLSNGLSDSETLKKAVDYAVGKGVILVSAVGNLGDTYKKDKYYYPAAYKGVIGVGAVSKGKVVSKFSQRNNSVYVVTDGENIHVKDLTGNDKTVRGTSYSAALISAYAANKGYRNLPMFKEYLKNKAEDLGPPGFDVNYGNGYIKVTEEGYQ
jgi:hypothetical protein